MPVGGSHGVIDVSDGWRLGGVSVRAAGEMAVVGGGANGGGRWRQRS